MLALSLGLTGVSYFLLGIADSYALLLGAMLVVGVGPSLFHPPALSALSRRFADRRAFAVSMHGAGGSVGEVLGPVTAAGLVAVLYWRDVLQLSMFPALVAAFLMWRLLRDNSDAGSGASSLGAYLGAFWALLRQRAMLMLCAVSALRSVGQATTMVFLPVYLREDLGYSAALVGVYVSMAQLAGIGSQPLMGHLADRFGHRAVLLPAMTAFALLLLTLSVVEGRLQFALAILALGAFVFSLHHVILAAGLEIAGPEMQATTVSLLFAAGFVGSVAPTLAGLLADAYGLRSTFIFSAAIATMAALVLVFIRLPRHEPGQAGGAG
jgi:predicted MFS family arabinose efflux permease